METTKERYSNTGIWNWTAHNLILFHFIMQEILVIIFFRRGWGESFPSDTMFNLGEFHVTLTVYWHPALINKDGIHPLFGPFSHPSQKTAFILYKHLHQVLGNIDQATKLVGAFGADDEVYFRQRQTIFRA